MKSILFFLATSAVTGLLAQKNQIDGKLANTTKIKLKGSLTGWIYYSYPVAGGPVTTSKPGWDVVDNKAWINFKCTSNV